MGGLPALGQWNTQSNKGGQAAHATRQQYALLSDIGLPMVPSAPSDVARRQEAGGFARPVRVGMWDLLRLLGQGRMSAVYQAHPSGEQSGRSPCYAVKLLRRRWHQDPTAIECLQREALIGRRVSHPHLVSVLAAHTQELPYYLVMPLLQGTTLYRRLRQRPPSVTMALCIARQVAQALEELQRHGWLHADVKPANIFLSSGGHATLMDLGFVQRLDEQRSPIGRQVLGTVNYMAPEMLTSVWAADHRSDIYSLGVTLFEMLALRLPFCSSDVGQVALAHLRQSPPDVKRLAPAVPRDVANLVAAMLAKDPLRRPDSYPQLVHRLAKLEIQTLTDRRPTLGAA